MLRKTITRKFFVAPLAFVAANAMTSPMQAAEPDAAAAAAPAAAPAAASASASASAAAAASASVPASPPPRPAPRPLVEPPFWSGPRVAAAIIVVSGVGALVVGSIYAGRSDESTSQLSTHCLTSDPDKCDATGYALRDKAALDARIATISLGVGATAVFAGLVLGWINPGGTTFGSGSSVSVAPVISAGTRGLSIVGSF